MSFISITTGAQGPDKWRDGMRLIFKQGSVEIWEVTEARFTEFYVYGVTADPRVCPSLAMAREVAAGAL